MLRRTIFLAVALCAVAAEAAVVRDIPYAPENGKFGLGDLYLPEKMTPETPVVLTIHGGGWGAGDATARTRKRSSPRLTAGKGMWISSLSRARGRAK